jgi:hypothetical protein
MEPEGDVASEGDQITYKGYKCSLTRHTRPPPFPIIPSVCTGLPIPNLPLRPGFT